MRMTRAKAAALAGPDDSAAIGLAKKPLQSKKSTTHAITSNAAAGQKKRAALGDRSNIVKNETIEVKEGKKATVGRPALMSKATTQNAGVQKSSKVAPTRSILDPKDNNKKPDLKRPIKEKGDVGNVTKKKNTVSTITRSINKDEIPLPLAENEPPKKSTFAVEIEHRVVEKKETVDQKEVVEKKEVIKVEEPKLETEDIKQAFADSVLDLDREDIEDPLMVAEYVVEIFDYLRDIEESTMANPDYMEHQDDLEWKQRGILIDWLIEVHTRFHLLPETLFLAVNIIDRFLSTKVVRLEKLQLVGATAMFIASKYEEVLSPHVQNFRHVADDGFTEAEILSAERYILAALNYNLSYPNPMNFLRRISKADNYDIQTRTLGKYFLEIGLVDHRFIEYAPSHIAAASMYLARLILDRGDWVSTLATLY